MATTNKNFKVKHGLIVEGSVATVNGNQVLTEDASDQYIIDLIGGETLVTSVESTQMEVIAGELNIKSGVFDPAGSASTAESNANTYTDTALEDYTPTASLDTTVGGYGYLKNADLPTMYSDSDVDAHLSGGDGITYSTGTISADVAGGLEITAGQIVVDRTTTDTWYDAAGAAAAAQTAAEGFATTAANNAQTAAEGFATQAIADLVDSAPATLDTLNELAAALQDNPDVISDLQDIASGKQDTLTAGSNIDITGATISVTGLTSAEISDFDSQAVTANTGLWDTIGAAATAETNANNYTNTALEDYTTTANLENTIDGYGFAYTSELPTSSDDLSEGVTNLFYTDGRAEDAAGNLLANATKSNIQISYSGGVLDIAAEDGVADSTTFDLAEDPAGSGTSGTWYFTDERAVNALEAVVPNFTAIEVDGYAKQIASNLLVTTASTQTAYSFDKAVYRSGKFLIKTAYGTHTELTEVLLTLDSSDNIAITEYATIGTNGSSMSVTADVSGSDVRIRVTTVNDESDVTVYGTLLK